MATSQDSDFEFKAIRDYAIDQHINNGRSLSSVYREMIEKNQITMSYQSFYYRFKRAIPCKKISERIDARWEWIKSSLMDKKGIKSIHKEFCDSEHITCSPSTFYKFIKKNKGGVKQIPKASNNLSANCGL